MSALLELTVVMKVHVLTVLIQKVVLPAFVSQAMREMDALAVYMP